MQVVTAMRTRMRTKMLGSMLLGLLTISVLNGCAMVEVRSMKPADYIALQRGDILTTNKLSSATLDVLNVVDLDESSCRKNVSACIAAITSTAGLTDERRLSSLSELWMLAAMQGVRGPAPASTETVMNAWLEVARYAYAYLFFTGRTPGERAFEDRQTQVKDYYNYAVQQATVFLFHHQQAVNGTDAQWSSAPIQIGDWTIEVDRSNLQNINQLPEEVIPAASLRFNGLRSVYRRDGFGAELVAVMPQAPLSDSMTTRLDQFLKKTKKTTVYSEMPSPEVTVMFRFVGFSLPEVLATHHLQLATYDPYMQSRVIIKDQTVPLAGNFTAGYGLWLARSGFATQSLRTLFGSSEGITTPHVYLMQPFDPKRRVIVMLHGLASSPEAWVNVANEVLGDEALRQHYQIWQIYYPTNAPIAYNVSLIRDALNQTLKHFDPTGSAPASHDMVLIGHSMGGVISRLLVSSSQDQLWNALFGDKQLDPDRLAKLHKRLDPFLTFQPMPNVERVIFIAAPHRGTPFANNTIGRWVGNLIKLPISLLDRFDDVAQILTDGKINLLSGKDRIVPNSIDNLKDTDPFVRAAATLPISPDVKYHSIIAKRKASTPLLDSDDGVVPYRSAHLDGALSERVIISSHSVQGTPQSILEIRRILHEDLGDSDKVAFERSDAAEPENTAGPAGQTVNMSPSERLSQTQQ